MPIANRLPITDTNAIPHHPQATIPISSPYPYHRPPTTGPTVRNAAETDCPKPWIVPSTLGCGLLLLRRMILPGIVTVLAIVCRSETKVMPNQTAGPDAANGAGDVDGRMAMYGARK